MWTASARQLYRRSGGRCASDMTDAEFALIEPLCCPGPKRGGRPRTTLLIERSFAWLSRNRRLAKDFERLIEASTANGRPRDNPAPRPPPGKSLIFMPNFSDRL